MHRAKDRANTTVSSNDRRATSPCVGARQIAGCGFRVLIVGILNLTLLWLVTIRIPTAIWVGNFTLNAYPIGVATLLAGSLAVICLVLFVTKNAPQHRSLQQTPKSLILGSPSGIPLLIYSVVSLGLNFRIERLQNTLV